MNTKFVLIIFIIKLNDIFGTPIDTTENPGQRELSKLLSLVDPKKLAQRDGKRWEWWPEILEAELVENYPNEIQRAKNYPDEYEPPRSYPDDDDRALIYSTRRSRFNPTPPTIGPPLPPPFPSIKTPLKDIPRPKPYNPRPFVPQVSGIPSNPSPQRPVFWEQVDISWPQNELQDNSTENSTKPPEENLTK